MAKKKIELDKLDIDELIDEIKDQDEEEGVKKEKEQPTESEPDKKEEKPSFLKNKKLIFFIIWIILFIVGSFFGYLTYKEKNRIIPVYSVPIIINTNIIYLSKKRNRNF